MGINWPLLMIGLFIGHGKANGNVGCLFSEELCRAELEWCFDDGAFGRCVDVNDPREPSELYRHSLSEEELAILEGELEKLLEMGYRWSHRHTQCLLQALLFAFENGTPLDASMCHQYKGVDLQANLASPDDELEPMAYIKFTPSAGNPQSDYADEVYYPPAVDEGELKSTSLTTPDPPSLLGVPLMEKTQMADVQPPPIGRIIGAGGGEFIPEPAGMQEEIPPFVIRRSLESHFMPDYNSPESFRSGFEIKDILPREQEEEPHVNIERPYAALRSLTSWPAKDEVNSRDDVDYLGAEEISESLRNILKPSFSLFKSSPGTYGNNNQDLEYEVDNQKGRIIRFEDDGRGYTEGGTVFQDEEDSLPELFDKLNGALGFKRRERLDVKKPGPPYDPAFQEPKDKSKEEVEEKPVTKAEGEKEDLADQLPPKFHSGIEWPQVMRKKNNPIRVTTTPNLDVIDTNYAFIQFKESIHAWSEGQKIMATVTKMLNLPNGTFSHLELDHNEVAFKVDPSKAGMDASAVSEKIEKMKEEISHATGVTITTTGIGFKKAKLPTAVRLTGNSDHQVYIFGVVIAGVLAAIALSAGVLYLTKKHGHKLRSHMKSDGQPMSKLYQLRGMIQPEALGINKTKTWLKDLCRARMSTKPPSQQESTIPAQRVTSLSKESDKDSPSSRSSTSSWSEEPALTNMDVSTGQMVLSYMEEHLKNKERMESEWAALCAYEADPSATTIAQRAENQQKNRYPHALPYDHARVVLNELSNITGSDYINASTITDHDPRNPAYIVTQGPLPHTTPDLWQMVWEQGCVAMVMLTRLGEADSPLCYHYWPEEGSELYHVYEVHLVSEHIWCDDYLVRSFYLKNLKTGETRTVTQFHFMSWPEAGVPSSTKPLLEFRRKVNKSFRGRSCPIVVHCSDGVGRSGAYVLLDMVLNRIAKGAKEIDVGATLEHIRDQRAGAVATKQQFQFVLQAVADEVQAILKLLPQQP